MIPFSTTLSRAARSALKPTPSSMKVDRRPLHPDPAGVDAVDPGEALQQRALAAAVAPGDAEELALPDLEGDVVERREASRAACGAAGAATRSLSVWARSSGTPKVLLTESTTIGGAEGERRDTGGKGTVGHAPIGSYRRV